MFFSCSHPVNKLMGPFIDEMDKAYKVCSECSKRLDAPIWNGRRIGQWSPVATRRTPGLSPLTGIERKQFGVTE